MRALAFSFLALSFIHAPFLWAKSPEPRKLVLAVDGLSYDAFEAAKNQGLFKTFQFSSKQITPYPSLKDLTWNEIFGIQRIFPIRGNLRTPESQFFSIESMSTFNDPRYPIYRQGSAYHYSRAFDSFQSPILELLPISSSPVEEELKEIKKRILRDFRSSHYIAWIRSIGKISRSQPRQMHPGLSLLSQFIKELQEELPRGEEVEFWIISPSGNSTHSLEETSETPLISIDLESLVTQSGFHFKRDQLLENSDIVFPSSSPHSAAFAYFADLNRRQEFSEKVLDQPGISLVTFLEISPEGKKYIKVLGKNKSQARISWRTQNSQKEYSYLALNENPLEVPTSLVSSAGSSLFWIKDSQFFEALKESSYPDSIFRLVNLNDGLLTHPPDLVLNAKNGFYFRASSEHPEGLLRTSGALNAGSSIAVLASSQTPLPSYVRSNQVLELMSLTETQVFGSISNLFYRSKEKMIEDLWSLQRSPNLFSQKSEAPEVRSFRKQARILSTTVEYISPNEFEQIEKSSETNLWDSIRKVWMKGYALPTFVKKLFFENDSPSTLNEDHLKFARYWYQYQTKPQLLFQEVFGDRQRIWKAHPALPRPLYNPKPQKLTVVFVSGIYNELFNSESFLPALRNLYENFGLEILPVKVHGLCPSHMNAKTVYQALKDHTDRVLHRGQPTPKYLLIGYSKGGIDSLESLVIDPKFTQNHIKALVTIASPLKGVDISADKDIPNFVKETFNSPKENCEGQAAFESVQTLARDQFWKENIETLTGLIPYASVSFSSGFFGTHIFMKGGKLIADFGEANDGVVTVENSSFPESLNPHHLGTINVDHLAGVLSSDFPQEAFFEAIVMTLSELGAL